MRQTATLGIVAILALTVAVVPLGSESQVPQGVRIGYLDGGSPTELKRYLGAFREALQELGYAEGKNLTIEYRWAEGRYDRLPALAVELVNRKVKVIVAGIAQAARAAKQATAAIPVVMVAVVDPVGFGLVQSLARPGGNLTGLSTLSLELVAKQLELLKRETAPKISRVAVLWNAANPVEVRLWRARQAAARALGLTLVPVEVSDHDDFGVAFSVLAKERVEALNVLGDPLIIAHRREIIDYAAKNRLAIVSDLREFTEAGGLMSYGAPLDDLFRRAATYVDKILKGAKPADLPVEQPTKFELVINMKTAKALGLTIPPSLLLRADQVIK